MSTLIERHRRDEGFTLIELMIVMVVIGILAGIVLFAVGTFQEDAEESTREANERICETARAAWAARSEDSTSVWSDYFANDEPPDECPTAPATP